MIDSYMLAYRIRISANYTGASKSYLIHLYPSRGKDKNRAFYVFDIRWLYRTSRYDIVRVDVTKRHGIDITIWRMSAIEVSALSRTHFQK